MNVAELKSILKTKSNEILDKRIVEIEQQIKEFQEEANAVKNSAEDKFDSTKEDLQNKKEAHKKHLAELLKGKAILHQLKTAESSVIVLGTIIETNEANYFICANLPVHDIEVKNKKYIPITFNSPICQVLREASIGETIEFRERDITIKNIY